MNPAHYETIACAIRYLDAHREDQPGLGELAAATGLSECHLQRVFTEWAGISPKRFLQALTRAHARQRLRSERSTFEVALDAGLSGGGRLHDLFVECEGVTPGEVARLGAGLQIAHGFAVTPFGRALIGWSHRGVCHLRFVDNGDPSALMELRTEWPQASLLRADAEAATLADRIFESGVSADFLQADHPPPNRSPLALWVKGTNFQIQVWHALLQLPEGSCTTYGELAARLGRPAAARAVGSAVGANPVGWLIPCHRVIRQTGALGGYRWGLVRKQAMLASEYACHTLT